jgi:hypothetical protein
VLRELLCPCLLHAPHACLLTALLRKLLPLLLDCFALTLLLHSLLKRLRRLDALLSRLGPLLCPTCHTAACVRL